MAATGSSRPRRPLMAVSHPLDVPVRRPHRRSNKTYRLSKDRWLRNNARELVATWLWDVHGWTPLANNLLCPLTDLNRRLLAYHANTLPSELRGQGLACHWALQQYTRSRASIATVGCTGRVSRPLTGRGRGFDGRNETRGRWWRMPPRGGHHGTERGHLGCIATSTLCQS